MLPENHKEIIEAIMLSASRCRSMAHSEMGPEIDKALKHTMPFLWDGKQSPLIEACSRYLDHPYGQGFYNIIAATKKEFMVEMYLEFYQGIKLPEPDIKWCLDD